jgi:hypothetical protein
MRKPFRYLVAKVKGVSVEGSSTAPQPVAAAASTVVAVPIDRAAACIVRAAFDSAMLEYGPATIFDLQTEGLENCDYCSTVVANLLRRCAASDESLSCDGGFCLQFIHDTPQCCPTSLCLSVYQQKSACHCCSPQRTSALGKELFAPDAERAVSGTVLGTLVWMQH